MDEKLMGMSLEDKESHSKKIILETMDRYGTDVALAFSGGKDSTTLLHLVRSAFGGAGQSIVTKFVNKLYNL